MPSEGMPKHLAKGSFAAFLEKRYQTPRTAREALKKLRQGAPLTGIGSFDAFPVSVNQKAKLKTHMDADWIGPTNAATGTSGWWHGYRGEPEAVLREGLIRALEVAIGLDHLPGADAMTQVSWRTPATGNPLAASQSQSGLLPLDMYWVCGVPRFEIYVSWNVRQVTMIALTPGFSDSSADPELDVQDYPDQAGDPGMGKWIKNPRGILFVGQNVDTSVNKVLAMKPGVVVNAMHKRRGGIGSAYR